MHADTQHASEETSGDLRGAFPDFAGEFRAAFDEQDAQFRKLALEKQGSGRSGKSTTHDDDVVVCGTIDSISDRSGFPVIHDLHG
jgi:hypothetical protein